MAFVSNYIKSSISKVYSAATFPYSIGNKDDRYDSNSIWTLHFGTKKEDKSPVSIFSFDIARNTEMLEMAQNFVKRIKTIRHPVMLRYIDSLENDSIIYVVTEAITPLTAEISELRSAKQECLIWGLYTIAQGVGFMNNNVNLVHGNVRLNSVFIGQSGEWKLGGFELTSAFNDSGSIFNSNGGFLPDSNRYAPPEIRSNGWHAVKNNHVWSVDSWMYACFLFECFNGVFSRPEQLNKSGDMPMNIFPHYQRLLAHDPKKRPSVADLIQAGSYPKSFFDNDFIRTAEFLENITVKDNADKIKFFRNLSHITEKFPENFSKYKLLPVLINALEFGSAGPKVLSTILSIGNSFLSEKEYKDQIIGLISRLFEVPDRATRSSLLENLPFFSDKLDKSTASDVIFPQMVNGFNDSAPFMREATLKAVLLIVPLVTRTIFTLFMF
jgi:SCY1-like protein 1